MVSAVAVVSFGSAAVSLVSFVSAAVAVVSFIECGFYPPPPVVFVRRLLWLGFAVPALVPACGHRAGLPRRFAYRRHIHSLVRHRGLVRSGVVKFGALETKTASADALAAGRDLETIVERHR